MKKKRIIPRLDVKGPNVVKGLHLEGLRIIDTPSALAKKYYRQGADELVYMDIVASLYGRSINVELVNAVANELFIPLTVGGGIQSLHDINNVLRAGADKVAINTYATRRPEFLREAVHFVGAQCIVLSIEAKRTAPGRWEVYTEGGREHTGLDAVEWAKRGLDMGVGEIMLTSVDYDGTRKGYDRELIQAVAPLCSVPVTVYGGAGKSNDLTAAIAEDGVDGVCVATILHYNDTTIGDLKRDVAGAGIPIRQT